MTTDKTVGEFETAATRFIEAREFIDSESLEATMLLTVARNLDLRWASQAYAELLRTVKYLESLNPINEGEADEVDPLLSPKR